MLVLRNPGTKRMSKELLRFKNLLGIMAWMLLYKARKGNNHDGNVPLFCCVSFMIIVLFIYSWKCRSWKIMSSMSFYTCHLKQKEKLFMRILSVT